MARITLLPSSATKTLPEPSAAMLAGYMKSAALPAPMIPRELRAEYMAAVSGATGTTRNYAPLALLHAQAVRRSLACLLALARLEPEDPSEAPLVEARAAAASAAALAAALERSECALGLQQPADFAATAAST